MACPAFPSFTNNERLAMHFLFLLLPSHFLLDIGLTVKKEERKDRRLGSLSLVFSLSRNIATLGPYSLPATV
jgi:hypothetical protein